MTQRSEVERENEMLRRRLEEAEDTIRALYAGEVDAVVVAAEREQVYTLETADKTYRLLVEQMPQAAATLTVEGEVLSCNRGFATLLGRLPADLMHKRFIDFVAAENRPKVEALLQESLATEIQVQLDLQHVDSTSVPLYLRVTALKEGAWGQCLLVTDQTEQRHYQELVQTQESLRVAMEALERSNVEKDEFLATLAHELRNPLAPIRSAVEIIKLGDASHPDLLWAGEIIDRQVQVMARLLEDLLDISRLSRQRLELRKERLELAAVVEIALETSRPLIDARHHQLTLDLPPEPILLEADPVRLAQVFSNLLNNAAKYTEEGGHIRLGVERRDNEVVVSVRDNGIGIDPEALPRVFEIFSQAAPLSMQSRCGLGIGLSLVKGLVELHGGSVDARSEGKGQGSVFSVRLPVVPGTRAEPASHGENGEAASPHTRRVLVVDDNRDSADSLSRLLQLAGHEVRTAYGGQQALEVAAQLRPEIVLLDLGMPVMDGYQTCRRLRGEPWGRNIFVAALTGWGQETDRQRTTEAGFDAHLVKPVHPAKLLELMRSESRD